MMIRLEYFNRNDFELLIDWVDHPELLLQWAGPTFEFPITIDQLEHYIKGANHKSANHYVYKVINEETNERIGHISLGRVDRINRCARIGKVLVGKGHLRGKGVGQQMIQEILKIAFKELNLHRVSLGVYDFNTAAIACYEKVGFQKEGLLREVAKFEDVYWSSWEMSLLENEWKGEV